MSTRCTARWTLRAFLFSLTILSSSRLVSAETPENLTGTWVYKLGPRVLVALRLELDPGKKPTQLHGYLLHPEHFNVNWSGGTVLLFSGLNNVSDRDPFVSAGSHDGEVVLRDDTPMKPGEKAADRLELGVRSLDQSHTHFGFLRRWRRSVWRRWL